MWHSWRLMWLGVLFLGSVHSCSAYPCSCCCCCCCSISITFNHYNSYMTLALFIFPEQCPITYFQIPNASTEMERNRERGYICLNWSEVAAQNDGKRRENDGKRKSIKSWMDCRAACGARFNRLRAQRASLRAAAKVRAKARAHLAKDAPERGAGSMHCLGGMS